LLIDSNVRYEKDGSFGHTRCFIRDDTGRKIRESHATLLLEETKRSMVMLDNFMARSLHHLRTPLHVTQAMVDSITMYFKTHAVFDDQETRDCRDMVDMASEQISQSVGFLDDIADLAKFDQGAVLHLTPEVVDLENFGKSMLAAMPDQKYDVRAVLDLRQGECSGEGPAMAVTDQKVLRRSLLHLLNNAVDVTHSGTVTLGIGYKNKCLTFYVSDTGPGLEMPEDAAEGDLPVIFQKYHKELVPEESLDLTIAATMRDRVEQTINSHKKTGMGIGLSLTYHLVQSLGGEIRCTTVIDGGTKFQFSLPRRVSYNSTVPSIPSLGALQLNRPERVLNGMKPFETMADDDTTEMSSTMSTITEATEDWGNKRSFEMPMDILPQVPACELASEGVMSKNPPSILVVEDTKACAKLMCRILSQFKCATKWVENGKLAVDCLKEATPGTYDMILMDLRMPVMDGLEATRKIKHELGITVPVIALTGDDTESTREEAAKIGFDGFHGKPMRRDDLKSIIKEFTGYEVQ
jgi:CheY-like chemotaxis protein